MNLTFFNIFLFIVANTGVISSLKQNSALARIPSISKSYYFRTSGNDNNDGSLNHPFNSIAKFDSMHFHAGDKIYFHGGDVFDGGILINSSSQGTAADPIVISSYGNGDATINPENLAAFTIYNTKNIVVRNLDLEGSGRKNGNRKNGFSIINCDHIKAEALDISGFQKSGLLIYSSTNIRISGIHVHENGAAGIAVEGSHGKKESRNIQIMDCSAVDNPGDPTNLTNHSGNGIVAGHCTNLLIDHCTATDNGWDMPRIGNGPVGIWCYESDSVVIQHCLSYRNKTSVGGADGGGFDLDGGTTNSIIQYCLSYSNQGSGYCLFQYLGASPWFNNIVRFNISENDGSVSDSKAGIYIWNSSGDRDQFHNANVYNNTIYNNLEAAISYSDKCERKQFAFYNNILVGKDSLIKGNKGNDIFLGNDWWSLNEKFNADGMHDFSAWTKKYHIEMISGKLAGTNINPDFKNPGKTSLVSFPKPGSFDNYNIGENSLLRNQGLDLHWQLGIHSGNMDFNLSSVPAKGVGACF
jgi:hypothetical protein